MQIGVRACLAAGFLAAAVVNPAGADNPVAQAIQRLHLSPQQLLSVRDFLGPFSRGIEIEAAAGGTFVLRDDTSMAYAGEFSVRTQSDGSVVVERVGGPATIDAEHVVTVPLALDRKSRGLVTDVLVNSQAAKPPQPAPPVDAPSGPLVAAAVSSAVPVGQLPALKLVDPKAQGTVSQARAVFFRDGSGYVRNIRASLTTTVAAPATLKVSDRYFSPIQSDGAKVWRPAIVELEVDLPIGFTDLESRYACDTGTTCKPLHALTPATGIHLIKWTKQLVASVPPQLLAQIAPPPAPPAVTPADSGPAPAAQTPPSETAPTPASPQNNENF